MKQVNNKLANTGIVFNKNLHANTHTRIHRQVNRFSARMIHFIRIQQRNFNIDCKILFYFIFLLHYKCPFTHTSGYANVKVHKCKGVRERNRDSMWVRQCAFVCARITQYCKLQVLLSSFQGYCIHTYIQVHMFTIKADLKRRVQVWIFYNYTYAYVLI